MRLSNQLVCVWYPVSSAEIGPLPPRGFARIGNQSNMATRRKVLSIGSHMLSHPEEKQGPDA
jgi:hypothetical protein